MLVPLTSYQFIAALESMPRDEDGILNVASLGLPTVVFVAGLSVAGGCMYAAHRLRK